MKNSFPKKSFSSFGKGEKRTTSDRPFKKGSSSSRPYVAPTRYGADSKASSYRGKDFRKETTGKEDSRASYPVRSTARTYASSPSSSPKSVYRPSAERSTYKGKDFRFVRGERSAGRTVSKSRDSYVTRTPSVKRSFPLDKKSPHAPSSLPTATPDTSWGGVADWYNKHLEKSDETYHAKVVFPNLLRMLGDVSGKRILDMACGQGIFAEQLRSSGAFVTGVDIGKELIKIAESHNESVKEKGTHKVVYHVASADDLYMLKDASFDIVVCILALQNIENLQKTIEEASRVLTHNGKLFLVLNHPSFRNPKQTYWGYNVADDTQYRRVDEYMSESRVKIDMTPGSLKDKKFTVSFHRPLQVYVKALAKHGLLIRHLEEWNSHKESEKGPKQRAENKARKEIPMFMCIETIKLGAKD